MSHNNLFILTGEVQSGKTTALQQFVYGKEVSGFLCPDINGLRYLQDLNTQKLLPFQKKKSVNSENIAIGKFIFDQNTFNIAKNILINIKPSKLFIVDEIGKLELNHKGLEPELSMAIASLKQTNHPSIFVVRAALLEQIVHKYQLQKAHILYASKLNLLEKLF